MKIKVMLLVLVLLFPLFLSACGKKDGVKSFKAIVEKFDKHISTSPVFFISAPFPDSPSGTVFIY